MLWNQIKNTDLAGLFFAKFERIIFGEIIIGHEWKSTFLENATKATVT